MAYVLPSPFTPSLPFTHMAFPAVTSPTPTPTPTHPPEHLLEQLKSCTVAARSLAKQAFSPLTKSESTAASLVPDHLLLPWAPGPTSREALSQNAWNGAQVPGNPQAPLSQTRFPVLNTSITLPKIDLKKKKKTNKKLSKLFSHIYFPSLFMLPIYMHDDFVSHEPFFSHLLGCLCVVL